MGPASLLVAHSGHVLGESWADLFSGVAVDKLDGKISTEFFDRKSDEWQSEQFRLLRCMEDHQHASKTYFDEGVNLLELVSKAHKLFESQLPHEKRRLLLFVLSNCTWKGGEL